MGATISNFGILNNVYQKGVTWTLNNNVKMKKMARKSTLKWTGDHLVYRVHLERNSGIEGSQDGDNWPTANVQVYASGTVYRKILQSSVQITIPLLATARDDVNAGVDALTSEMGGTVLDFAKLCNLMAYKSGNGAVATVQTGTTGTTLKVDDSRALWKGGTYDVYDSTLATNRGTLSIASKTRAPDSSGYAVCTTDATVPTGTTATDLVVWRNSVNNMVTGLDALVDNTTGTFQGISITNNPEYTSIVDSNSGTNRALTPTLYRRLLAAIFSEHGVESGRYVCITNPHIGVEHEELYEGELRITPDTKTVGNPSPSFASGFGNIQVEYDTDAPFNKLYLPDFNEIYWAEQLPMTWIADTNDSPLRVSEVSAVVRGHLMEIGEYYIENRNSSGRIDDITQDPLTMLA